MSKFTAKIYYLPIWCLSLLLAVFVASIYGLRVLLVFWVCTALGLTLKNYRIVVLLILFAAAVGGARFYLQEALFKKNTELAGREVSFTANVIEHEIRYSRQQRLVLQVVRSDRESLQGKKIIATVQRFPDYKRGVMVTGSCLLKAPEAFDGFAYDRYLASKKIFLICENLRIESSHPSQFSFKHPFSYSNHQLASVIESLWVRPSSSLVLGLLVGSRESFSENMIDDFSRSGITHIIALSGYNITILIVFFDLIFIRLMLLKRVRIMLIAVAIFIFTIFVGAAASIFRAALMGSLVLFSKYSSRQVYPVRLLLVSAAMMILLQPFVLVYDMGFQLSFLATIGLLYLIPVFEKWFKFLPSFFAIRESLSTTMAATIMTLPLIVYQFEKVAVVGPLANVMVLPLIPLLMAGSALAVLISFVSKTLAMPLIVMVDLGCRAVFDISHWFAWLTWSSFNLTMSATGLIISYALLSLWIYFNVQKLKV